MMKEYYVEVINDITDGLLIKFTNGQKFSVSVNEIKYTRRFT